MKRKLYVKIQCDKQPAHSSANCQYFFASGQNLFHFHFCRVKQIIILTDCNFDANKTVIPRTAGALFMGSRNSTDPMFVGRTNPVYRVRTHQLLLVAPSPPPPSPRSAHVAGFCVIFYIILQDFFQDFAEILWKSCNIL